MDTLYKTYWSVNTQEFEKIRSGKKSFALCPDDGCADSGCQLVVSEITNGYLLGRRLRRTIKSVQRKTVGLAEGWCILGW